MKAKKKLIGILLVIVVIVLSLGVLTACGEAPGETSKNKKAVVICTALLSGGLYDTKTNEAIWDPVAEGVYFQQAFPGGDMMGLVMAVLTDKTTYDLIDGIMNYKDESVENLLWQITLDEQGKSNNPNLRPANVRPTTADGTFKSTLYNDSGEVVDGYGAYTAGEKFNTAQSPRIVSNAWTCKPDTKSRAGTSSFSTMTGASTTGSIPNFLNNSFRPTAGKK